MHSPPDAILDQLCGSMALPEGDLRWARRMRSAYRRNGRLTLRQIGVVERFCKKLGHPIGDRPRWAAGLKPKKAA